MYGFQFVRAYEASKSPFANAISKRVSCLHRVSVDMTQTVFNRIREYFLLGIVYKTLDQPTITSKPTE